MSGQNTPNKDASTMSSSGMDSSTFYSINDSDLENMNISMEMDKSMLKSTESEATLLDLSQSTLNFILEEQEQGMAAAKSNDDKKTTKSADAGNSSQIKDISTPTVADASNKANNNVNDTISSPASPSTTILIDDNVNKNVGLPMEKKKNNDKSISIIEISDTSLGDEAIIISSGSEDENSLDSSSAKDIQNLAIDENPISYTSESAVAEEDAETKVKIYKTLEEFDKNLPHTVTVLNTPFGSKVYLVGTAHFSRESQDDVSLVIRNVHPDIVMVELCASRIHILKHDEKTLLEEARDINVTKIRSIIKENGLVNGIFYIVLLNMSAKLTKELGMAPGGEFRRALEEVHRLQNCILQLGDRPINITLKRALHGLSFWQTLKIVWKLAMSNEKISKEDVEQCKQKDLLEELMEEMAGEYPAFRDVFVTERDLYLCHSLQVAASPQAQPAGPPRPVKVVGVVGIGHCAGITQHWGKVDANRIPEITTIPPPSLSTRLAKFTIKYGILGLIGYGVFRVVRPRIVHLL